MPNFPRTDLAVEAEALRSADARPGRDAREGAEGRPG